MKSRKWLVRGLVYSVLAGMVLLYFAYSLYTNPTATRKTVLDKLSEKFLGATTSLQSARLNLLEGISLSELRMARRDDLDNSDFLYVPSAVLYHDKEQLLHGKLALRKIVLNRPQLRILLDRNGRCNLTGLLGPVDPNERVPTLVFQQGTIMIEDRRLAVGKSILEVRNVNLTILNDPLPTLVVEGGGQTDVLGPLQFRAEAQRVGGVFSANLELPTVPIGPLLVQRLSEFQPDVAIHCRELQAQGKVRADVSYQPSATPALGLNLTCQIARGHLSHARLPFSLENVALNLNLVNDPPPPGLSPGQPTPPLNLRVPSAVLTASAGPTRLEASLKDLILSQFNQGPAEPSKPAESNAPPGGGPKRSNLPAWLVELPASEFNYKVEHLNVTPDLFKFLPDFMHEISTEYKPSGPIRVRHEYHRDKPGKWDKHYFFHPENMEVECARFPYPLHGITGVIERHTASDHSNKMEFKLAGFGGNRPVTFEGHVEGERATSEVDLKINATDVPIDEHLHQGLKPYPGSQTVAAQFHPEGLADIYVHLFRERGHHEFKNHYRIGVHHASIKYDQFPYPLQQVRGVVDIYQNPCYWVCHSFRGVHKDGEIFVEGRSFPPTAEMVKAGGAGSEQGQAGDHRQGRAGEQGFRGGPGPADHSRPGRVAKDLPHPVADRPAAFPGRGHRQSQSAPRPGRGRQRPGLSDETQVLRVRPQRCQRQCPLPARPRRDEGPQGPARQHHHRREKRPDAADR